MSHPKKTANGNGGGKWITKQRRLAIYLRDSFSCSWCGRDLHKADRREITLDHLHCRTKADGKPDHSTTNLVTSCRSCNSRRQDKAVATFAKAMGGVLVLNRVRRNSHRSLVPFTKLAKSLISQPKAA